MNYIRNGVYDAKLLSAHYGQSKTGRPIVEFLWLIENSDLTIKSFLHLEGKNGLRNVKGIQMTQYWASDWDGNDPEWFQEHLDVCTKYKVRLTVVNEVSPTEPGRSFTHVKWVSLRHPAQAHRKEGTGKRDERPVALRKIAPEAFAELPEGIKSTMGGAWGAFSFLTREWSASERERKWFAIIGNVAPGKDQIDFTPEEWQKVIEAMREE